MSQPFDPYHQWLGIPPAEQPPHHYRLLGLRPFEGDPDAIEHAADRLMGYVRGFQTGQRAAESQQILNELAAAKLCLLDPNTKRTYDAVLQGQLHAGAPAPTPPPTLTTPTPPTPAAPQPPAMMAPAATPPVQPTYTTTAVPMAEADDPLYRQPWFAPAVIGGVVLLVGLILGTALLMRKSNDEGVADATAEPVKEETPAEPPVVEVAAPPEVVIQQELGGELQFSATTATIEGGGAQLTTQGDRSVIVDIKSSGNLLVWEFRIETPASFRIEATYAATEFMENGQFQVGTDDRQSKSIRVRDTGGLESFTTEPVGFLLIRRSGRHRLTLRPLKINAGQSLMTFHSIRLSPVRGG